MQKRRQHKIWCAVIILILTSGLARLALAQTVPKPDGKVAAEVKALERLEWRSIGPANMGGRGSDVEGVPGNPNIVYAATGSGGLWKTTNGGMTWKPVFERQGTISIGDIALEPNNPDVIWVGTGESNVRNSVSFGDGVYKSNDGGRTWQHMGLRDSNTISRIVVHPSNPDIVYVAAVGHAFGPSEERGVFMTTDGGKTWQKTLYIDSSHGASDIEIDPSNPNILYAGIWNFERKPWTFRSGDEKGGLFRSIDGGRTWNKVTSGLPKLIGRVGVRTAPSNPNVVYAIIEAKEGTLYRSEDKGETFQQVSKDQRIVGRGFYYTRISVDPTNENRVFAIASPLFLSIDGGRTFRVISPRTHIDYHAFWIDPKNPSRMWQAQDGGFAVSNDGGDTWAFANNLPIGQFYQIHADNRQPFYYITGGLQDNGTWAGPSRTREPAGILNEDWRMVSFGDGFYALNHADDPDLYITESQGGEIVRTDFRNREQQSISPYRASGGGAAAEAKYRFNWNSPLVPSPHDKNTVYLAGNVVFRSTDFGKSWEKISNDLTTNDKEKQKEAGGPVATENSSAEYYCTIISISESPMRAGVIWVGTDDGNLQLTTDAGKTWTNLIRNVQGVPALSSVSHVEPSRANAALTYVAFDRHKLDDYRPYIYRTSDGGKTWANISGDLPGKAYVHIVREDPKNPNLIYAGTELGLFGSYNGGKNWVSLGLKNLPAVAVHDILIHPRDNDLILATHGRSLWVFDDATAIQQMSAEVLNSDAQMFDIRPALRFTTRFTRYGMGDAIFAGPNPQDGALITYYLKNKPDEKTKVKIQILDASGKVVRELSQVPAEQGLNRTAWDLRHEGPRVRRPPSEEETRFFGGPRSSQVMPGSYTVKLMVGDKSYQKQVEVRMDPTVTVTTADLQLQEEVTLKLRSMLSSTNDALRLLDSVKGQLEQIEKTVKDRVPDAPDELTKAITGYKKQVDTLMSSLARPQGEGGIGGGSKLSEKLGTLFFEIDGVNAAPTPAQKESFAELQTEFQQRLNEVNRFVNETVPKMNDTLRRFNAPTIIAGKPIELPR